MGSLILAINAIHLNTVVPVFPFGFTLVKVTLNSSHPPIQASVQVSGLPPRQIAKGQFSSAMSTPAKSAKESEHLQEGELLPWVVSHLL